MAVQAFRLGEKAGRKTRPTLSFPNFYQEVTNFSGKNLNVGIYDNNLKA
jgi:hypothetical protein